MRGNSKKKFFTHKLSDVSATNVRFFDKFHAGNHGSASSGSDDKIQSMIN